MTQTAFREDEIRLLEITEDQPVEDVVEQIIRYAADSRAADVFFASEENAVLVSCRQMGVVRMLRPFSFEFGRRMLNYIKTVSNMDIAERLRPTEGRWLLRRDDESSIDLRINSIPTIHGEDVTIRLLDRRFGLIPLEEFQLQERELQAMKNLLRRTSGLILVTGPTGSGKSTTLYSCLDALNDGTRKINTLEDPVEYVLRGIRQSQVNHKLGVGFSDLLTACLRQSPDVIMIGEIRDPKTAVTAVRAANSGHLVLATMHAPLAVKAIRSMVTMGVPIQNFADSLLGVISQRLIRQLCPHCRLHVELPEADGFLDDIRPLLPGNWKPSLFEPVGCDRCFETGFSRPLCVPEILTLNNSLRNLIIAGRSLTEIEQQAREDAMITFRQSAMTRVALGLTTIQEVMRVIPFDDLRDLDDEDWEQPLKTITRSIQDSQLTHLSHPENGTPAIDDRSTGSGVQNKELSDDSSMPNHG